MGAMDQPLRLTSASCVTSDAPCRRQSLLTVRPHQMDSSAVLKLMLFAFFVFTRAVHPLLLDASKQDGRMLYAKNTVVVAAKISIVALMNVFALFAGGVEGVRQCWQPRCMAVFGLIGTIYALGDFLEMLSMSKLSGGVYQTLLQTKLLITALMLWWLKGTKQTTLQSHVLFATFLAMSSFVIVDEGRAQGGGGSGGSLPLLAVLCVMLKVAVSCYCAVLSEKYLKAYASMPFYAKISSLSTTWALASTLLCFATEHKTMEDGFFANWNTVTCLVVVSFVVKTLSTQYLLQKLDSVQKNIGEAIAVIAIYLSQVSLPGFGKSFELSVFLLAVLVVALVKTYLLSAPSAVAAAAAKREAGRARPAAKRVNVVSVNPQGTQLMQSVGRSTLLCEVEEALPQGVFYGMLGDVHPVCGNTHPQSAHRCELMLLGERAANGPVCGKPVSLPYLPQQSLTVLGRVREALPRKDLTADQFTLDAEKARSGIVDVYATMCDVA